MKLTGFSGYSAKVGVENVVSARAQAVAASIYLNKCHLPDLRSHIA